MTSNPYCQLSDVRALLGNKSNVDDAWLTSMISQAQAAIDRELGYSFQTISATRKFSGKDREDLFVGKIVSFSQVLEQSSSGVAATTNDITSDCYIGPDNESPGWVLSRFSGDLFNKGRQNYSVTGVFGIPTIPGDITRCCARIVVQWAKMRDTNYADFLLEQGSVKQKYVKELAPDIREVLDSYRKRGFYSG